MRILVTDVQTDSHGLRVSLSMKWRQQQHDVVARVPWKWIAATDAAERIDTELARTGRHRQRPHEPWLPLETWE